MHACIASTQMRDTPLDLIAFCASNSDPRQFLHMEEDEMEELLDGDMIIVLCGWVCARVQMCVDMADLCPSYGESVWR